MQGLDFGLRECGIDGIWKVPLEAVPTTGDQDVLRRPGCRKLFITESQNFAPSLLAPIGPENLTFALQE